MSAVETISMTGQTGRVGAAGAAAAGRCSEAQTLGRGEELALLRRARGGDAAARNQIIEGNIRLVYQLARKYRCRRLTLEDLVQEGIIGLTTAIDRFDPGRGCRLSTYAVHWIRQAISRAVEQQDRLFRLPALAISDFRRLQVEREALTRALGREPDDGELAEACGLTEARVAELVRASQDPVSLETLVGADMEVALGELAEDPAAADPEWETVLADDQRQLRLLLSSLPSRERSVLEARFGFGDQPARSLAEVGELLHMSREGVRQVELRAIARLRYALNRCGWE